MRAGVPRRGGGEGPDGAAVIPTIAMLAEPVPMPGALFFPVVRVLDTWARLDHPPAEGQVFLAVHLRSGYERSATSEPWRVRTSLPSKGGE